MQPAAGSAAGDDSTLVLICCIRTQKQFVQQPVKVDPNGKAVVARPIKTCQKHRNLNADASQPSLRGRYEQLNNCDMSVFFFGLHFALIVGGRAAVSERMP